MRERGTVCEGTSGIGHNRLGVYQNEENENLPSEVSFALEVREASVEEI